MQSTDKFAKRRKVFLIVSILVVIFSIIYLIYAGLTKNNSNPNEYYDPGSGETVSNPENREQERYEEYEIPSARITFLGLKGLLNSGVAQYQVEAYKKAIGEFSEANNSFVKEASTNISTIKSEMMIENEEAYKKTSFELTINRNIKYSADLYLVSLSKVYLVLNQDGRQVFKSTIVDGYDEAFVDPDEYSNQVE